MDGLHKGLSGQFVFINQAEGKIRFNSLYSVSEESKYGQNIVLLEKILNQLSPEEFHEAKHFIAKFFNRLLS